MGCDVHTGGSDTGGASPNCVACSLLLLLPHPQGAGTGNQGPGPVTVILNAVKDLSEGRSSLPVPGSRSLVPALTRKIRGHSPAAHSAGNPLREDS
jgi:hypothetical protein